jgi:hypothetical protein
MQALYLLVFILKLLIKTDDFMFKLRKLSFVRILHVDILYLELDKFLVL